MIYATRSDIETLYGADELLRVAENGNTREVDATAVERGLVSASAEIDGHIGLQYALPLSATTETLKRLCVDIALYRLALKAGPRTDEHRVRYEDAIKFLERVANGKATIGIPVSQEEPPEEATTFGWGFLSISRG